MRWFSFALAALALTALPALATAAEPTTVVLLEATPPSVPSPLQMCIIGLSLTAVAVIGARVSNRTTDTMMYMVLASVAVTAVLVAYADRVHTGFYRAGIERLQQLRQEYAGRAQS